ncbi:uncharacterized protein LOC144120632 isoform X3 [Amblyomma americanum]
MNTAVIMRNSKVRTFLYVLLGCCMMFTVFLLSSTHTKLKDSQESNDKCQQQRDSLAAQLQVVYEHKSRLEKTLQLETTDRKKAEDAVKTIRDQAERDRADARNEIKKLEKELEELKNATRNMTQAANATANNATQLANGSSSNATQNVTQPAAAQAEEFKNLKASFDTLHQEKEKVDNELASHITLLQQERDSRQKLERHLMELQEARKTQGQLELMHQRELETCRVETAQLYAKLQQQNMVHPQQLVASGGHVKPASSADFLAAGVPRAVQAGVPAVAPAQTATEAKANAKEDKGAGKMGSRYQGAGAESRQPKMVGDLGANNDSKLIADVRNPNLAKQVLGSPIEPAAQHPAKGSSMHGQPGELPAAAANSLSQAAAPPLQSDKQPSQGNSAQLQELPLPAGHVPLALSQPGAPQVALQPAAVGEPLRQPAEPQPLARPAVQPVQDGQQGAQQPGSHLEPLPEANIPLVQAPLGPNQPESVGHGLLKAKAVSLPVVRRIPRPGQFAAAGQSQEQQPAAELAEQPPVNQGPPVLPPPNIVKPQPSAAGVEVKDQVLAAPQSVDVIDEPVNEAAGLDKAAGAAGSHMAAAAVNKKDAEVAAVLEEENEVEGGHNHKALPAKSANNGQEFLLGPGNAKLPRAKVGRPNQQQLGVGGGGGGGDDDLDYGNAAVKDDDAAEDQEDDGPFGAVGDLGRGKPMPDAADFDDQGAEVDPQQLQQQQPNNLHEDGIAANPK